MQEKGYSPVFVVFTYAFMSRCWAGKAGCGLWEMTADALAGAVRGVVMVNLDKKMPTYISRFFAALLATIFIVTVGKFVRPYPIGIMNEINYMILPMAAGAMLVEGLYTCREQPGRKKFYTSIAVSLSLALGAFIGVIITGVRYA